MWFEPVVYDYMSRTVLYLNIKYSVEMVTNYNVQV